MQPLLGRLSLPDSSVGGSRKKTQSQTAFGVRGFKQRRLKKIRFSKRSQVAGQINFSENKKAPLNSASRFGTSCNKRLLKKLFSYSLPSSSSPVSDTLR